MRRAQIEAELEQDQLKRGRFLVYTGKK